MGSLFSHFLNLPYMLLVLALQGHQCLSLGPGKVGSHVFGEGEGEGGGMEIEGPREEIEEEEEEDVLRKQERNRYTRRMANGVDVSHNASRVPDCPWRHRPSISAVDHF